MPKIEIDGVSINADPGATIIEVADRLSIPIPRFCYHQKLSVAANCRMCLVQVEKSSKALPACATPVADGMKVWTKSKEAIAAQRAVMEFLLINHPLDCPVCDQGGECELQDVSLEYGRDNSRFTEPKRAVLDHSIGSLIATEMTRCIHCTRCVRFGDEISGERELGATGRGEFMEIGTFITQTVNSEVSANIIDLCPVGALTSKPFRFKARAWDLAEAPGISPHDCIGSNLYLHTMHQKVMRVVPKEADALNEVWLSDRDRFSYESLQHEDRLRKPLLFKQNKWHTVSWVEALRYAIAGLKLTIDTYGAGKLGVLLSPSLSTEEYYLIQKFVRALNCNNIDHRLRQLDFSDQDLAPTYPNLGIDFREIAHLDTALLIGTNIAKEQPLAGLRLRKMVKNGGKVVVINAVDYRFNFAIDQKLIVPAKDLLITVAGIAKELIRLADFKVDPNENASLSAVKVGDKEKALATMLLTGKKKQIILGHIAQMHPQATQLIALSNLIAKIIDGKCGSFSDGANAAGAWLAGCVPHRLPGGSKIENEGKNALEMLQTPLNCYILYAVEPEFDSILGAQALEVLKKADFVLAISPFQSDVLLDIADVILPLAQFGEYDGSMININGTTQVFTAVVEPFGESRPGWKILRVLGNLAELSGFEYNTLNEIREEMQNHIVLDTALPKWQQQNIAQINNTTNTDLLRIAPISLYAIDGLVRRAKALQQTKDAHREGKIAINSKIASNLNVVDHEIVNVSIPEVSEITVQLSVCIDDSIADHTAMVYQANSHTLDLGPPYSKLEVRKC